MSEGMMWCGQLLVALLWHSLDSEGTTETIKTIIRTVDLEKGTQVSLLWVEILTIQPPRESVTD